MSVIQRIPGLVAASGMPAVIIPPAPWSPADIPGIVGFWVPDTLGLSPGNAVASLPSSAATPQTLEQSSASARPLYTLQNSEGALNFDGADDGLLTPDGTLTNAAQSISFFTLVKLDALPTATTFYSMLFRTPITAGAAQVRIFLGVDNATKKWAMGSRVLDAGGLVPFLSSVVADTNPHVLSATFGFAAQQMRIYLDGTRIANLNPAAAYTLPASDIAPTMIGNTLDCVMGPHGYTKSATAMADLDRQKWEGWAAHYWGIAANLPSDHPFKLAPPT